jgi:ribosome-associated translation inhibitor RaiA
MELEVASRNVEMTLRWKTEIESRMADLQRRHEDLIHGRVKLPLAYFLWLIFPERSSIRSLQA